MTTMRAARLHEIATPFRIDPVPIPTIGPQEVLVRVRTCGVVPNLKNVTHYYPEWFPMLPLPELPATFGLDPAGEIAAVGSDVQELVPGQRVYVNPARGCGSCVSCADGLPVQCNSFAFAGYFGSSQSAQRVQQRYPAGGLAEYLVAPVYSIVPLDDAVTFETASHFGYLGTSYAALRQGQAGPDTTVLVNGASGTLGVGAVLLALAMGVRKVLAVARDKDRLDRVKALCPNRIAIHSVQDGPCTEWALKQTGGRGADLVIEALPTDAPSSATFDAFNAARRGGRIVNIGGGNQPLGLFPVWFQATQTTVSGSVWFTSSQARDLSAMIAAGTLDVSQFEYQRFGLDSVNDAVDAAHSRPDGGFNHVVVLTE